MLRRSQKTQDKDKILKLGNIVLDREKHSVMVGKEPVELTYKEYELLKLLMTNAGDRDYQGTDLRPGVGD